MKISRTLWAQAIRFGEVSTKNQLAVYGKHLVRALEGRYGFIEVPSKAEEFVPEKGISFLHGYFENRLVIDRLRIYNNGITVEAASKTDDCEEFIDDLISWSPSALGLSFHENLSFPRMFNSHLELESDLDLQARLNGASEIANSLSDMLKSYRDNNREFRFGGFDFRIDPTINGPSLFRFERRANAPFSANLYFSSAPLRTQDHLAILEKIETLFGQA